jgi:hypothetical protein
MELEVLGGGGATLQGMQQVAMEIYSPLLHRDSIVRLQEAGLAIEAERFDGRTGLVLASRHDPAAA